MLLEITFANLKSSVKYVELIAAIIGLFYLYKYKHTYLKYFLILLWFIVLTEFFGKYYNTIFESNHIVYNIYHLVNFSFILILYKNYTKNLNYKKWIFIFIISYIVCFFFNLIWQNYLTQIQTIPFIIGAIFVIISIAFYFFEILNTDKVLYVSKNLLFWISIGFLLYFVGKIPTRIVRNYWTSYYKDIHVAEYILSIVMNICFIIGFICSKKDKQY